MKVGLVRLFHLGWRNGRSNRFRRINPLSQYDAYMPVSDIQKLSD